MSYQTLKDITQELTNFAAQVSDEGVEALESLILDANHIFVAGAGRSGFMARAFANRLMHLGFDVSFVGEPTTPPIREGDLLIVGSGSGKTASLVNCANKAHEVGAKIGAVTINPDSPVGHLADATVLLPGTTRALEGRDSMENVSIQPVGTMFEQLSFLTYDSIILDLLKKTGQSFDDLLGRHANME